MTSILVTGGAGFIGSHFARAAVDAGHHVVVLDDLSNGKVMPGFPRLDALVVGDIANKALVRDVIRTHKVRAYAHFAGKISVAESVANPALYFDHNITRTLAFLDVVLEHRPRAFVFSSSAAVYGEAANLVTEDALRVPVNPYGISKLTIEVVLKSYGERLGLPWAALRYFNAAGAHPDGSLAERHEPETHLIPLAIDAARSSRGAVRVFGNDYPTRDGTCVRDYVHVCDLARAHLTALTELEAGHPVGAVNLGSGIGVTVREVLEEVARAVGRLVPHVLAPRRAGDPPVLTASSKRAHEVLGWQSRIPFDTIVEDAVRSRRGMS